MTHVFNLKKSKFRHEIHLNNNRGHHKAADSYFHGLGQIKAFEMVQFHLSLWCVTILRHFLSLLRHHYRIEKRLRVVGAFFLFKRLDRNGSISLKCMCVIILWHCLSVAVR